MLLDPSCGFNYFACCAWCLQGTGHHICSLLMFVSKLGPTRRSDAAGPAGAGGRYTVHPARSRPGQPRHRGDQRQLRRPRYRKVALRPRLGPRRDLDQPEPQRRLAHQGQRPRLRYAATSTSFRRPVTHAFLSPMHSTPRTLHDVPHRRSAQPMPIGCGLVLASDDITHLVHFPPPLFFCSFAPPGRSYVLTTDYADESVRPTTGGFGAGWMYVVRFPSRQHCIHADLGCVPPAPRGHVHFCALVSLVRIWGPS